MCAYEQYNNSRDSERKPRRLFYLEGGLGFDLYFPLFKFSPEISFSRGMTDLLDNTENKYGKPLKRVNTNTITVYLLFQ